MNSSGGDCVPDILWVDSFVGEREDKEIGCGGGRESSGHEAVSYGAV